MTTVLVDMDGVLAWWEKQFIKEMRETAPHIKMFDFGARTHKDQAAINLITKMPEAINILSRPGFYRDLAPIEGGLQALEEMVEAGFDVAICTAPSVNNLYCGTEKMEWVLEHLGEYWLERLIITRDKTRVKGDYLIDDRVTVRGSQTPEWEHVFYTQSYNAHVEGQARIADWSEWRNVIKEKP